VKTIIDVLVYLHYFSQ